MIAARRRIGERDSVRLLIDRDQTMAGGTTNLRPAVQRLRVHGVAVRLFPGRRLHAKALITDTGYMVGSTNWTSASQPNEERAALLRLDEATLDHEVADFNALWAASRDYDGRGEIVRTPSRPLAPPR